MKEGYKDSLLGLIPNDWELTTLGELLEVNTGSKNAQDSVVDGEFPFFTRSVNTQKIDTYSYDTEALFIAGEGIFKVKHYEGKFDVHQRTYILTRKNDVKSSLKFLQNQIQSRIVKLVDTSVGSTVQSLRKPIIQDLKLVVPPLPEQQKIAEILSTVDAKIEVIDQQITETQALKKGLMQRLLTKGIGHTEFKDSPLGEIPKSWEVVELYELRDKNDRYGFTGGPFGSDLKSEHYTESGVKIIQLQNIGEGKFIDKGFAFTSEEKANELHSCNIFPGEIILAKMAPVARCCIVPSTDERYVMCSDGIRLSVNREKYDNEFVFQALNSKYFRDEAEAKSTGTTRARIGLKELKQIPVLIPKNIEEQKSIAKILSTVDDKLEVLSKKKTHYQELKQGLMQQLLTGKIRVKL